MNPEQKKAMLGMTSGGGQAFYKLNKITMSGDDGTFKHTDLLTEREKGTKPTIEELGKQLDGVIVKMRWALSKYDEPNSTFYSSTEYDDKWKGEVTIYPPKDKGSVETMKAKYGLGTQRIVYFYVPARKEIVRLIVKASALSGKDKNPNGELGLFEYMDEYAQTETLPCDFITSCTGVFRKGKNQDGSPNKRKDHFAMSFKIGRQLTESEQEKVQKMMIEVNEKTHAPVQEESAPESAPEPPKESDPMDNFPPKDVSEENVSSIPF